MFKFLFVYKVDRAIDGDNTTVAETVVASFPWVSIDLGRSVRVTRVQILGGKGMTGE